MKVDISVNGNDMLVRLGGRLDTMTAPQLESELNAKLDGITGLTLDFAELLYISSAGLRVILSCQKKMNAASGTMIIKNVNTMIMDIFEATGFIDILTIE